MHLAAKMMAVGLVAAAVGQPATTPKGRVFVPEDTQSFPVSTRDVVRLKGPSPGSTGTSTKVTVVQGEATVMERPVFAVVHGKPVTIGGGSLEFDVAPKAGTTGTVKVKVVTTPPGGQGVEKVYEFEVK